MIKHNQKIRKYFVGATFVLYLVLVGGSIYLPRIIRTIQDHSVALAEYGNTEDFEAQNKQDTLVRAIAENEEEFISKYQADLEKSFPRNLSPQPGSEAVPVLLYHRIVEEPEYETELRVENFIDQLTALKRAGYETISLKDYHNFIFNDFALPARPVIITFDDGEKSSLYKVDPVLKYLGYQAVNFIIAQHVDDYSGDYYLSPEELKYMVESSRWEFGSHSYRGHSKISIDKDSQSNFLSSLRWLPELERQELAHEYAQRIKNDLQTSQDILEDKFNTQIMAMAFPFGDYGEDNSLEQDILLGLSQQIFSITFKQTVLTREKKFNYPGQGFLGQRIVVSDSWSGEDLIQILKSEDEKNLPYQEKFNNQYNWQSQWGVFKLENNKLSLESEPSGTGASVKLMNAQNWQHYEAMASLSLEAGESFSLLARYQDDENYISCLYSLDGAVLKQVVDGREERLLFWDQKFSPAEYKDIEAGVYVKDNIARCSLNGNYILRTSRIDPELNSGGIGFKVWSGEAGQAKLKVYNIVVE